MIRVNRYIFLPVAVAVMLVSGPTVAAPITWTLDATFGTDGTAGGTFDYDASSGLYSAIDLTTASVATPSFSGGTFSSYDPSSHSELLNLIGSFGSDGGLISLYFISPLTSSGGVVSLRPTNPQSALFNTNNNDFSILVGSVSATALVPVPAAVWLFGSALGGLGWMRRRKTA